jgi:HD-GYP domain-containing protein (c-di-GMP phosphodiesterase class II)
VADAYDAITSARAYRPGRDSAAAIAELDRYAGTQFDPDALGALLAVLPHVETAPAFTPEVAREHQPA